MSDDIKKLNTIATLLLSGSTIKIGAEQHPTGDSVWIQTEDDNEPVYMTVQEARLLSTAIDTAISETTNP
jgi:hypothetical protein